MKRSKLNTIILAGCITANLALVGGQKVLATTKNEGTERNIDKETAKDINKNNKKHHKKKKKKEVEVNKEVSKDVEKQQVQQSTQEKDKKSEEKQNKPDVKEKKDNTEKDKEQGIVVPEKKEDKKEEDIHKKEPEKKDDNKKQEDKKQDVKGQEEKKENPKKDEHKESAKKEEGKDVAVINGIKVDKELINMNYSKGVTIVPKYIVIHDTDNRDITANAMANRNYFGNHPEAKASAHYVVDESNIIQVLQDNWRGWHIGDGHNPIISNSNTIGIELCVNRENNFDKTLENGIALTKYLMKKYNIPAKNVVRHHDCSGKICPKMMMEDRPDLWPYFKSRITGSSAPIPKDNFKPIGTGRVANVSSVLNVRLEAYKSAPVISSLTNNQYVNVYGEENGWYKIDYLDNNHKKYGYVSKDYLNFEENQKEKPKEENKASNKPAESQKDNKPVNIVKKENNINKDGQVIGITSYLNVRNGLSVKTEIISSLKNNDKIHINYEENGWYNITFKENKKGFVKKDYIKVLENEKNGKDNNTSPKIEAKSNGKGKVVVSSVLNLRKGPGVNYSVIGSLHNNKEVEILENSGQWYKVKADGKEGYAFKSYIKVIEQGNSAKPKVKDDKQEKQDKVEQSKVKSKMGTVIVSSSLNVRSGAGTSYAVIDSLPKNKKVEIVADLGHWYKVKFDDKEGYVSSNYIKINEENKDNNVKADSYKLGNVVNVNTNLNVRKGPGTNYLVVGYLLPGDGVKIKAQCNGWYKITFNTALGEKEGFVKSDYIKVK